MILVQGTAIKSLFHLGILIALLKAAVDRLTDTISEEKIPNLRYIQFILVL